MTSRPNLLFLRLSGLNRTVFMDGTGFRIQEMRRPRWWDRIQGGTLRHTMHALIVAGSVASRIFTYECRRVSGQGMAESKRIPRSMSGSVLTSPKCGFWLTSLQSRTEAKDDVTTSRGSGEYPHRTPLRILVVVSDGRSAKRRAAK
ncbi:hypothetical protein GGP41_001624 [Bipolaris sorokiniana]|uniref:Uncharacterized protein n=1 Tax=Cochliobolus sativus TaxID=45130 RepID=A0A8H5ZQ80_COCSA|nr:hypothetical protein GGP41_001624 [Bipolaris sorokiniana]